MSLENVRSCEELLAAVRKGLRPHYLFFWGHQPLPNGEIGTPCLSQWWPSTFLIEKTSYSTAEHFMMAEKARLFGDEVTRAKILQASSPKIVKQLGREVRNFKEDVWEQSRFEIVVNGNYAKFSQHPELAKFLLGTGPGIIVEASPLDRVWGIGLGAANELATNPDRWRGLNLLGFALMEVRERLRN